MKKSAEARPSSLIRWNEVFSEVSSSERDGDDGSREWPHPDYFAAASRCKKEDASLEKLRQLCDDLESTVSLIPGPGSFARLAGVPTHTLSRLGRRCWRDVLCDAQHSRLVWIAIGNYGDALQGKGMDSGSARIGRVFSTVATFRLEKMGEPLNAARRKQCAAEQQQLLNKDYLPKFIKDIFVRM